MLKWLLVLLVIAGTLLAWRVTAAGKRGLPRRGETLPEFSLPDQHGALRSDREFRGRWLVLYFYPRDDTPGCTEQAARFRDTMREFEAAGAAVCGVSVDDSESHAEFARKYQLPFALLADRDGATARRYGSLLDLGVVRFARRNTFLIDPQGRIAGVWLGVSPARNAGDMLKAIKEAQS